jgi:copper homeostasis protein
LKRCTIEIIGFTIEGCRAAQAAGAQRIELCDNPGEGGTTPSHGFITAARKLLQVPLYPLIRPRGGDFFYSSLEFEIMMTDLQTCKELGCDGVVLGLLNKDGSIDKKRTARLVELAYPMEVGFHRAFDRCANPFEALEHIIDTGCERILTSGQQPTAVQGAMLIGELVNQANGRISIMPGSGVNSSNIIELAQKTGATEFHSSARMFVPGMMEYTHTAMNEKMQSLTVDDAEVRKMVSLLQEYSMKAV